MARYVNLTCGATISAPLFIDLNLVGPNFNGSGRSAQVAVFRFRAPTQLGFDTSITASTCLPATTFGTRLAAFNGCPDPWAAERDFAGYLQSHNAVAFSDDDAGCDGEHALTASGRSRASKLSITIANADGNPVDLYVANATTHA